MDYLKIVWKKTPSEITIKNYLNQSKVNHFQKLILEILISFLEIFSMNYCILIPLQKKIKELHFKHFLKVKKTFFFVNLFNFWVFYNIFFYAQLFFAFVFWKIFITLTTILLSFVFSSSERFWYLSQAFSEALIHFYIWKNKFCKKINAKICFL